MSAVIGDCEPEWICTLPGDPGELDPMSWRRPVPVYREDVPAVDLPDIGLWCG